MRFLRALWVILRVRAERGQAIVEVALVMPILMLALLGVGELGVLAATRYGFQDDVDVLAGWVAQHPASDWSGVVSWADCGAIPTVTIAGDVVTARVTCPYTSRVAPGLFSGLPVAVEASAPLLVHMAGGCGTVPSLVGLTADVAAHVLIASGFPTGGLGGTWIVRSQSHQAGYATPCYTLIGAFG